jgi:hypothetical protein
MNKKLARTPSDAEGFVIAEVLRLPVKMQRQGSNSEPLVAKTREEVRRYFFRCLAGSNGAAVEMWEGG